MVQLHYDENETRLIARKGKGVKVKKNSGQSIKNNVAYSKIKATSDPYRNAKNNKHVVVKITGGAKNAKSAYNHFDYISRNNQIPIFDELGEKLPLKQAKSEIDDLMDSLEKSRKDAKRTYQIAFSRSGKTDPELLKQIVFETVKSQFPNNRFYYAVHEDTDNTHVHVVIERKTKGVDQLLEINKNKLNQLKKCFAETQNRYGLQAIFLSETDKQKKRKNTLSQDKKREDKRKGANEYTVLDFGRGKYKFQENGKPSFYLFVETKNGEVKEHWSLGLQEEIGKKGVKIGDKITLKKTNITNKKELDNNGFFQKSTWNIEILERKGKVIEPRKDLHLNAEPLSKKRTLSTKSKLTNLACFSKLKRFSEQTKLSERLNNGKIKREDETGLHRHNGSGREQTTGNTPDNLRPLSEQRFDGTANAEWLSNKGVLFNNARYYLGSAQSGNQQYSGVQSLRRLHTSRQLVEQEFKVMDYGKAPYKFDEMGKQSYYIILQNSKGDFQDIWGKSLEKQIKEKGIRIGDIVRQSADNLKEFSKQNNPVKQENKLAQSQGNAQQNNSKMGI
ncbi:hypothetical protein A1D22_09155 [Pasteurellaceae bacterium LFhippo2]|nr:hypothetical protein [Pasteurellaceae bacterium LFhippo2]